MRVAVVGGGITGLTTAWSLQGHGIDDVVVLEASERAGGKVLTREIGGVPLELGADAFLTRRPHPVRLARSLGLGDELVAPATGRAWLWSDGRLRPFPGGTLFGLPADVPALARSGVLSAAGLARAVAEPLLPAGGDRTGRSVGEVVTERFGREVTERLVDPLLGGVHGGDVDRLALAAADPIREAAGHRSMLLGARRVRRRRSREGDGPPFLAPRGGMSRLVEALSDRLGERLRTGWSVTALRPDGPGWHVGGSGGSVTADAVVLAVPAPVAAELLEPVAPDAAAPLAGIRHASVATITLGYPVARLPGLPRGSGMLVPRREGRLIKAVTWTGTKWAHRAPGRRLWMRASVGRIGDTAPLRLPDHELARRVDREVAAAMGTGAAAEHRTVARWPDGLPQHEVGHAGRVARARGALPAGLHLAGAAYEGVGIASCVEQAEAVAARIAGI